MDIQLNRIILFAQDVNRLKKFYQEYFSFNLVEEIKNEWVVLNAGQIEIAFHKIGDAYKINKDIPFKVDSNTKLVFELNSALPAFRESLVEQGVLLRELKSFPGSNYLLCDGEDPEGNVFQLKQKFV